MSDVYVYPLKEKLTVFVDVIVRGHIVHKVFAAVWHKTSIKRNAVLIFFRHVSGLHPTLDVTIQIILKIDLLLNVYLRAIRAIESKNPLKQFCDKLWTCPDPSQA